MSCQGVGLMTSSPSHPQQAPPSTLLNDPSPLSTSPITPSHIFSFEMSTQQPVKTESETVSPRPPSAPPPPLATAGPSSQRWPAGSGLVFFFDPRTQNSKRTYEGLMVSQVDLVESIEEGKRRAHLLPSPFSSIRSPQKSTNQTLISTQWIEDATHILIDTSSPLTGFERDLYKGKKVLSLDWMRDSVVEGRARDETEKQYQVIWKPKLKRKIKVMKEERGGGGSGAGPSQFLEVAKGKKRARGDRRASTSEEDESSGDDR